MQTAIFFQTLSEADNYPYEQPLLTQLKQHFPHLVLFDFDTQSDRLLAGYANDLLEKADKALIVLEVSNGPAPGLITFLEKIITHKEKCLVLLSGKNDLAERMLTLLDKDKFLHTCENAVFVEKAAAFLSPGPR
jgi:hypothetical protein